MLTLSNGSELTVWEETDNPNPSPDAVLFSITETDGDVIGPIGAKPDFPFGGIDLASVDVFDGFFTITSFTNEGRTETWTTVETQVFDNEGNLIRTLSDQAAFLSAQIVSVNADSPDTITVTWIGANEYFGGENTQYGQHQIILEGGALQPDSFVNHAPTAADLNVSVSQGQFLDDIKFSAADADYDLLSFVVVDGPDHGTLEQSTSFDGNYYPFHQGHYGSSLHYHADFLSGNLFDYTPEAGFVGTDSFTVYATDGQGNSNVATITIAVTPPAESIALSDVTNVVSYGGYDHAVLVAALGGGDRISGTPFNDTLDGGAGHDQLFGGAGADTIIGGAGTDWLKGDAGSDAISGGAGTDGIRGDTGDDVLDGGAGSDDLRGGAGDDILNGGAGRDWLAGDAGRDVFVFDALGPANYDRIVDFNALDDVFRLDSSAFVGLSAGPLFAAVFTVGSEAIDDSDHIIYDDATGALLFDQDGAGGAAGVRFATVDPGTWLTADDFFVV
ncbi:calcium-binding protein [Mesorhizobium sp. M4B.F.Ca.ET.215.01.1.1]|uniref:Ig-like domain-containing protein n=1 Tax=unclassified Mesorhizobium TaxID=325217 RepID=UPI000FD32E65|nr:MULTISPECIES: Ig-like domain-containing protein [unclassified Mesorhizobium]RUW26595.1 calcium-binding protein [Mesorhizobium sp. M4B.F.Ca.ET.013.02.1.1]RWX68513.1 calcium-binding protein [Mesorhizobium sp. M4B.F.Ca.ET.089.01.1.1]TGQ06301.1 calcium-binding protein [Mesorhizobium sp. M4B.F.Ca.ET.215.01.1.1]TGQ32695.1 calcium-binding protein [Mesorhizobium sp. M00.F.Ca.ET.220.01.1.1]TGQ98909.1 calcium-binding protein [Mesorhizobium sp. M4B.F.Ca.ET.203.01.1.1]